MKNSRGYDVHSTACIDDPSSIGTGTKIWHFSHVMPNAIIGEHCNIGMNVFIDAHVRIGDRVKIQNNVSVYKAVEIEDDVFCGPSVVFTNVVNPRAFIERKHEFLPTIVRRGASLGANCTVVCGHEIGQYAFIGAGAVVTRDVPPYALMIGNPARRKGWMCVCGLRLKKESAGERYSCQCGAEYIEERETLIQSSAGKERIR